MKIFIIVAVCVAAVYAEDKADAIQQYERECRTENGIEPTADLKNLKDGNCYYACFYKKFGIMKEDGSYDPAAIKTKFSKPNSVSNEAVQKKLDEVTQTYCQDKVGNYCNLAACLSKVSKDQWEI